MNILHLEYSGGTGGIEKLCKDIGLHPGGDRHYFVFVHEGGAFYDEMQRAGLAVQCLHLQNKDIGRLYNVVEKMVRDEKIDAVVIHHAAPLIWLAMLLYLWLPHTAKVLVYVHNVYGEVIRHSKIRKIVYDMLLAKCSGIVAISEFVKKTVLDGSSIAPEKVRVIYNGIVCPEDVTVPNGALQEPVRLIFVGRLIRQKGVQVLLNAAALLEGRVSYRLQIVGDGPYRAELETLCRELHQEKYVTFCGSCHDVPERLKQADIFVHPTIGEEGFGLTVAEAMSYGKICIICNRGAIPEIITNEKNGFLVEAENPTALADRIASVCTAMTDAQRRQLQQNAIARARDFSIENLTQQLHAYIQSMEK